MKKIIFNIVCLLLSISIIIFLVDFVRFPECYITTWKYQLKNDLRRKNKSAIELYEDRYVKNNRDLFNDDFAVRNIYIEKDSVLLVETVNEEVPVETYKNGLKSIGYHTITAYCSCEKCCGKSNGITSIGCRAKSNRTIAVDPNKIPYGTKVIIDGKEYIAEDCGGAIKDNRIDIYFDTHEEALRFGKQQKEVFVYE